MRTMSNVEPIGRRDPNLPKVAEVGIHKLLRVRHWEYGDGQIVGDFGSLGVQIMWDKPITEGLLERILMHDRSWVLELDVVQ